MITYIIIEKKLKQCKNKVIMFLKRLGIVLKYKAKLFKFGL